MTVREYVKMQKFQLEKFELWWVEQGMIDPDSESFPSEMSPGDWDEQFNIFLDDESEEEDIDPDGDVYGYMLRDS